MNNWILMGRLTKDPEVRYGSNGMAIARFNVAVDRQFKKEGQPTADFFNLTAFGKTAEFVEKYLRKGTKIVAQAVIQNNNYEKDGKTVYDNQFIVNNLEFAESKGAQNNNTSSDMPTPSLKDELPVMANTSAKSTSVESAPSMGFVNVDDTDLPFARI